MRRVQRRIWDCRDGPQKTRDLWREKMTSCEVSDLCISGKRSLSVSLCHSTASPSLIEKQCWPRTSSTGQKPMVWVNLDLVIWHLPPHFGRTDSQMQGFLTGFKTDQSVISVRLWFVENETKGPHSGRQKSEGGSVRLASWRFIYHHFALQVRWRASDLVPASLMDLTHPNTFRMVGHGSKGLAPWHHQLTVDHERAPLIYNPWDTYGWCLIKNLT